MVTENTGISDLDLEMPVFLLGWGGYHVRSEYDNVIFRGLAKLLTLSCLIRQCWCGISENGAHPRSALGAFGLRASLGLSSINRREVG